MQVPPLHNYQERTISWMSDRDYGYLAIDMGLGKTRTMLEYIRRNNIEKVLVVAPLRVATSTWPSEIEKWTPELSYTILHGKNKEVNFRTAKRIYIINYEGLGWLRGMLNAYGRHKFMKGLLILDEATKVKSASTSRFKLLKEMRVIFSKAFALSATPSPNGYQDLWSQYYLLDSGRTLGTSYSKFFNKYFLQTESYRITPLSKERLAEIPKLCSSCTFRLKAEEYLALPDFVYNDIKVELPKNLQEQYKDFENDFYLQLEDNAVSATNAAVLSNKLRQFCQGSLYSDETKEVVYVHDLKLHTVIDTISELQGAPVLVAVQFRFEVDMLKKLMPWVPAIYGGTSATEADSIIKEWNKGNVPILICNPASVSHGVNLQSGGNNIIWLALTWNYEHYTQFNGRLRRQGQTKPVVLTRILIKGSIEERIAKALEVKNASQQDMLNAIMNK